MKRTVLLVLFGLAACVDPHEALSPDFGNSVRTNIDAQVVNPTPPVGLANTNGQRIENAVHRYQTNTVYPPKPEAGGALDTGSPNTGGGGGGSSTSTSTSP